MNSSTQHRVSFCITCKGRLEHLKKTLPENLRNNADYPNTEFVVLDYGSEDGLADWIKQNYQHEIDSKKIRYARFDAQHFHMAHAKNMAHRVATGDILCNLDADNVTAPGFAGWLNEQFNANPDIIVRVYWKKFMERMLTAKESPGFAGRIALSKKNFDKMRGYDERYEGWGGDDCNLEARAKQNGLELVKVPDDMRGYAIGHSHEERVANMAPVMQQTSYDRLTQPNSIGKRVVRKIKRMAGQRTDLHEQAQPPANLDGAYGCGKVRINFGEEVNLEAVPLQRVSTDAIDTSDRTDWTTSVGERRDIQLG